MNTIFLYAVVAIIVVVFVIFHCAGNKDLDVSVAPRMPKFGSNRKRVKRSVDSKYSDLSFSPKFVAYFIKTHGIGMLDNDLLDRYPDLANCRVADGFPCLCSAALYCLYWLTNIESYERNPSFQLFMAEMKMSYPDIEQARLRAIKYWNDISMEGHISFALATGSTCAADLYLVTEWLLKELTLQDKQQPDELFAEVVDRLAFWYKRIPSPDMIK